MRHPIVRITGPFDPRRMRWTSAASVANHREYRHRASGGTIFGASKRPSTPARISAPSTTSTTSRYLPSAVRPDGSSRMTNPRAITRPTPTPRSITALVTAARQSLPPPTTPKPKEQPGAPPRARHARQDLGEEHADSRRGDQGDTRHLLIARSERVYDIVPAQARERDLQHGHQDRERGPTKIQQRDRGQNSAQIDVPRDIPKARTGHEQLGCKDCSFFAPATTRPTWRLKIAGHAGAHSSLSLNLSTAATTGVIGQTSLWDGNGRDKC